MWSLADHAPLSKTHRSSNRSSGQGIIGGASSSKPQDKTLQDLKYRQLQ